MLKPEVIIIACAFQQIIHILSNNNEQRNVDELRVTVSKQLNNGSSRPRASEAAERGKHAYPDGELQIAENPLEGGASLRYQ